jgi:hypothetical protein
MAVKTNEINLVDGDGAALAKVARSRFLKVVSTRGSAGCSTITIVRPPEP